MGCAFHLRPSKLAGAVLLALAGTQAGAVIVLPITNQNSYLAGNLGPVTITFNADLLGALDTGHMGISPYPNNTVRPEVITDTDGFYTEARISMPLSSITYEYFEYGDLGLTHSKALALSTSGGFTWTAPKIKSVSSGGSLTITDLDLDLVNKKVYGTLIGGNGVGTRPHIELWNAQNVYLDDDGVGWYWHSPDSMGAWMGGLAITQDSLMLFSQSLGLLNLGKAAFFGITDYGSITAGVPEPGTWALTGLGLAGILLARHRPGGLLTKSRSAGCNRRQQGSHHSGCA